MGFSNSYIITENGPLSRTDHPFYLSHWRRRNSSKCCQSKGPLITSGSRVPSAGVMVGGTGDPTAVI